MGTTFGFAGQSRTTHSTIESKSDPEASSRIRFFFLAAAALAANNFQVLFAAGTTAGMVYLKQTATPELDRVASSRTLWREIAPRAGQVCVTDIKRDFQYGLNYYSEVPLPKCAEQRKPFRVVQPPGAPPSVVPALAETVDPH